MLVRSLTAADVMVAAPHSSNSSPKRAPSTPLAAPTATVPEGLCVSRCHQEISSLSWEATSHTQTEQHNRIQELINSNNLIVEMATKM